MLKFLWEKDGVKRWDEAESPEDIAFVYRTLKATLTRDELRDSTIFFSNAWGSSCPGDVFDLPVGTVITNEGERKKGRILRRTLSEIGVCYHVLYEDGTVGDVYDRNLEWRDDDENVGEDKV